MNRVHSRDAKWPIGGYRRAAWAFGGGLIVAMALGSRVAAAQDVTAAATAFSAGQQAELSREWARAAEFYALADRIAPSPEALRSVAKAYLAGGDRANAATQAEELLRRYPNDTASTTLAGVILQQTGSKLARWEVFCKPSCTVGVDTVAVSTEPRGDHIVYVDPGEHRLVAYFAGNRSASRSVTGDEGTRQQISLVPSAQAP